MKTRGILKIAMVIIGIIMLAFMGIAGAFGFAFLDGASYLATGSETLQPAGTPAGKALVVYDPGISGFSRDVAEKISAGLKLKGYEVVLAGIKSAAAANASACDVIVVGGPIYAGSASASVKAYLGSLQPGADARVGVFATGSDRDIIGSPAGLRKEATSLQEGDPLPVKAVVKLISGDNVGQNCAAFVDELLR